MWCLPTPIYHAYIYDLRVLRVNTRISNGKLLWLLQLFSSSSNLSLFLNVIDVKTWKYDNLFRKYLFFLSLHGNWIKEISRVNCIDSIWQNLLLFNLVQNRTKFTSCVSPKLLDWRPGFADIGPLYSSEGKQNKAHTYGMLCFMSSFYMYFYCCVLQN